MERWEGKIRVHGAIQVGYRDARGIDLVPGWIRYAVFESHSLTGLGFALYVPLYLREGTCAFPRCTPSMPTTSYTSDLNLTGLHFFSSTMVRARRNGVASSFCPHPHFRIFIRLCYVPARVSVSPSANGVSAANPGARCAPPANWLVAGSPINPEGAAEASSLTSLALASPRISRTPRVSLCLVSLAGPRHCALVPLANWPRDWNSALRASLPRRITHPWQRTTSLSAAVTFGRHLSPGRPDFSSRGTGYDNTLRRSPPRQHGRCPPTRPCSRLRATAPWAQ